MRRRVRVRVRVRVREGEREIYIYPEARLRTARRAVQADIGWSESKAGIVYSTERVFKHTVSLLRGACTQSDRSNALHASLGHLPRRLLEERGSTGVVLEVEIQHSGLPGSLVRLPVE